MRGFLQMVVRALSAPGIIRRPRRPGGGAQTLLVPGRWRRSSASAPCQSCCVLRAEPAASRDFGGPAGCQRVLHSARAFPAISIHTLFGLDGRCRHFGGAHSLQLPEQVEQPRRGGSGALCLVKSPSASDCCILQFHSTHAVKRGSSVSPLLTHLRTIARVDKPPTRMLRSRWTKDRPRIIGPSVNAVVLRPLPWRVT